ncbi:MAG TPA: hypothetical protein VFD87_15210 [Phototrophicaceae bacterium]|nr:hypothetical protein [Phototrophicaceae bacterium]
MTLLTIFEPMVLAAEFALVRTTLAAPTARMITPEAKATHSRVTRPSSSAKKRITPENISFTPGNRGNEQGPRPKGLDQKVVDKSIAGLQIA